MSPDETVAAWAAELPAPCTHEHVRPGFWYVRIPGTARSWIPLEIEVGARTVKVTSHVIIPPDENHAEVYEFLLRHNHAAKGVAFAIAPDGVICLVARLARDDLDTEMLDGTAGRIVEVTEVTFRTILQVGFASRLRRSRS